MRTKIRHCCDGVVLLAVLWLAFLLIMLERVKRGQESQAAEWAGEKPANPAAAAGP